MFIEVIPFGGSIDDKGLTYYAREELINCIHIGCLVEVPFRNAVDYAIVTNLSSSQIPENPKSIVRVITSIPLLAPYQIQTLFECASYYFVHAHQILSLFLSKTLVRYLEKKDFIALNNSYIGPEKKLQIGNKNPIQFYHHTSDVPFFEIIQKHIKGNFITKGNNNSLKTYLPEMGKNDEICMKIAHRNEPYDLYGEGGAQDLNANIEVIPRFIIIFPDDFAINAYIKSFPVDENILVIPDALTETKKHKAYFSVYNGEKNIIIGTRRILYYNLSHYENILYIEDALHKTAMRFNHIYKHLEILRKMSSFSDFNITILSTLPSIESMYFLHTGTYIRTEK
ncbi:hypothetical protein AUK10_01490 [Candidatus Gracilibacteria bacterium CG2_30_37_12]|nr:MAG: hypothetical protein AUK10_01490 [Candidatus Gracilibacteria bacterium CG2_30_37_12]